MRLLQRLPLRPLAIASLVANIGIVVTGGAVRLTGSGLGCPTWPQCTDESWIPHGAMGIHGLVEFGNRMLGGVVAAIAILTWIAVIADSPRRPGVRLLATVLALGVPLQAVIGGITVRTDLNPIWVSPHFMLSMVMIALAVTLVRRVSEPGGAATPTVPRPMRVLAWLTFAVTFVVLYIGTLVTGSGPHAGDAQSPRSGIDTEAISQLHADVVALLIGLTVGLLFGLRAVGAPSRAWRAAWLLLVAELAQGLVGIVQYVTDLPVLLVGIHMLGAALITAAATAVVLSTRDRVS